RLSQGDIPQLVARSHPRDSTRAIGIGVTIRTINREAVKCESQQRRELCRPDSAELCRQTWRELMMMIGAGNGIALANWRRMTQGRIESAGLHDNGVIVPNVLIVVRVRVLRVVNRHAVDQQADTPESRRRMGASSRL